MAGDCDRVSVGRSREQGWALSDHVNNAADVESAIVNRSQVVGDAWLWRCNLAVGQVIHRSQIVKVFHRLGLLASNRESSAFGLYELAVVALGQVAKDRAVQSCVGSLASRACPIALGFHRRDQLLCVHRFARFAKNFQGRSDAAQSLLAGVAGLGSFGLGFAWLLENRNRCGRIAPDRFDRGRLVLNHRYVAFGGDLRASALRTHFAQKALSALNENLLAGCEVGCIPATARLLGIDLNLTSVARNVRVVLATNLYFCLLHLRNSKSVFVVGCHRQADRTTDRLRASVLRFGLLTKDQVRQSFAKKVDHHLDLRIDRRHIQAAVEVEHHFAVGKSLNPKLRNLALVQLVRFALCVVSEDQGVETVFVVDLALHPRSASGAVAVADLGDREVEVMFGHLFVSLVGLVNRFRVNTHEPCGSKRIKPDSEGFRNLFFGAYLCSEMFGDLRGRYLHIGQLVKEMFQGCWVGSGEYRHLFDRCVQVADGLERSSVCAEELGRGQAWSIGHGWHLVSPKLVGTEIAFAMSHMSHAVQTASSRRGKDSEGSPESFPRRIAVLGSAIAACFPGPFAAVADLTTLDDVNDVFVGNVLIVVGFVVVVRVVHLLARGNATNAVLKRPVLLGHQPDLGVAAMFFAVVVEDFDQGVEIHVLVSVVVNEKSFSDNTHEPCGSNRSKPIPAAFRSVLAGFFTLPTVPNVGVSRVLSHVAYLVVFGEKDATVGDCREQIRERRASVRGVRGTALCGGLEDRAEPTSLHCVDGFDGVKVFDEQRACGLLLVGVGNLKGVCQGSQSLDRVVVSFSNFLSLVCVHRFENHAKGCVGCFVFVTVLGHGLVSVSEKGWNRLCDNTHEPCGSKHIKRIPRGIRSLVKCFSKAANPCGCAAELWANIRLVRHDHRQIALTNNGHRGFHSSLFFQQETSFTALELGCSRFEILAQVEEPIPNRMECVANIHRFDGFVGIELLEDASNELMSFVLWCCVHLQGSLFGIVNLCFDDTHEPCGSKRIKPSLQTFQKEFAGGSFGPPAIPSFSLVVLQKELEHGLLLVEFGEICFSFTRVAEIAFSELNPGHATGLVGQHGLRVVNRVLGPSQHLLCDACQAPLRVGDHPFEASQLCLNRLLDVVGCFAHSFFSVSEREWNRLRDDTHEPCGSNNLKPSIRGFQQESKCFSGSRRFAQNAPRRVAVRVWQLLVTYTIRPHGDVKLVPRRQTCESRTSVFGVSFGCGLCRAVVFAGEVEELGFDRFPFRFGFAGDLSVDLVAKGTLVPTLGPSESVEQSVEFGFAKASTRAIPATLSSFLLDVIPFVASFGIEGEFNQTQNHHQVSDHLGLVERSAEGSEFDSVLTSGQVGQVQQVVAIRFASALGVVFVAVLFDSLGVHYLFAFVSSCRGVDRSFVVADQGDQSCQGGRVSVPANRYVQIMESSP